MSHIQAVEKMNATIGHFPKKEFLVKNEGNA